METSTPANHLEGMRVLHLISSNGLFGAERVVLELSKRFKELGHLPTVGVLLNSHNAHVEVAQEAEANGIEQVIFRCRGRFDAPLIGTIRRYIRERGVDLVHCHGYKSNFYGLLASKSMVPAVTTNHNWLTSNWRLKVYCLLDSVWIRFFDTVVAVSEGIRDEMLRYRIPERKMRVIDNGIDVGMFRDVPPSEKLKKEFGINGASKVIGTIGSLGEEKGHIYLLRAAAGILKSHPDVKFLIVGDGPLKQWLQEEAARSGLAGSVIFTGYRRDIPSLLHIMDFFVLPSIKEGLPMVLLEAMAAGRAPVATKVGAVPKIIRDGENGLLVEAADIDGLKGAMQRLLEDPTYGRRLALAGLETVKGGYSAAAMCEKYMDVYREAILVRQARRTA